jgi:hypothetical protein
MAVKAEAPAKQGHDRADDHHAPALIARRGLVGVRCQGVDIVGLERHGVFRCMPDNQIETSIVPG